VSGKTSGDTKTTVVQSMPAGAYGPMAVACTCIELYWIKDFGVCGLYFFFCLVGFEF